MLGLRAGNASATSLQTSIYFESGATSSFDAAFDASALPSAIVLGLSTELGNELLAINGQPALSGAAVLLPLRITAAATGTYSLMVERLRNLLPTTTPTCAMPRPVPTRN